MTANTKKIVLYTGGAIVLGSVAFFVYSFFVKKDITLGSTSVALGNENPEDKKNSIVEPEKTNIFTKMLEQDFGGIKTPTLATAPFR